MHELCKKIILGELIRKYNTQGPRYTSYPSIPFWKEEKMSVQVWNEQLSSNISLFDSNSVSLYIHLPYCESLCTFCGCHKRITKNHTVEEPYIEALCKEWDLYTEKQLLEINEIHIGGGTPTFFKPENLRKLLNHLKPNFNSNFKELSFSFEAHPNNTSIEHLQVLNEFNFTRISFGIQDYDPIVQKAINRIQDFKTVKSIHEQAKRNGFTSISHDLVYGLPKQNKAGFEETVLKTIELKPERISLYSYAHVPWLKGNGQRGFDESDIPDNEIKRELYEMAKVKFIENGYVEIGMDHFALPYDDMAIAYKNKTLHRNFMGYTTQKTNLLIGIGASSISDVWFAFAQNEKNIDEYLAIIESGSLAIKKGHVLNQEDLIIRTCILQLMCQFKTDLPDNDSLKTRILKKLEPMINDDLVILKQNTVVISEMGLPFVRNVCMAFDTYLNESEKVLQFSKTI